MRHNQLFDRLIDTLQMKGGDNDVTILMKETRGITYLLISQPWDHDQDPSYEVFAIDSKKDFITKLRNYLGEQNLDPYEEETEEAVYEILRRYRLVDFNER